MKKSYLSLSLFIFSLLSFSSLLEAAAGGGGAAARTSPGQSWLRSPSGESLSPGEIACVLRELERKYPRILKDLIPRSQKSESRTEGRPFDDRVRCVAHMLDGEQGEAKRCPHRISYKERNKRYPREETSEETEFLACEEHLMKYLIPLKRLQASLKIYVHIHGPAADQEVLRLYLAVRRLLHAIFFAQGRTQEDKGHAFARHFQERELLEAGLDLSFVIDPEQLPDERKLLDCLRPRPEDLAHQSSDDDDEAAEALALALAADDPEEEEKTPSETCKKEEDLDFSLARLEELLAQHRVVDGEQAEELKPCEDWAVCQKFCLRMMHVLPSLMGENPASEAEAQVLIEHYNERLFRDFRQEGASVSRLKSSVKTILESFVRAYFVIANISDENYGSSPAEFIELLCELQNSELPEVRLAAFILFDTKLRRSWNVLAAKESLRFFELTGIIFPRDQERRDDDSQFNLSTKEEYEDLIRKIDQSIEEGQRDVASLQFSLLIDRNLVKGALAESGVQPDQLNPAPLFKLSSLLKNHLRLLSSLETILEESDQVCHEHLKPQAGFFLRDGGGDDEPERAVFEYSDHCQERLSRILLCINTKVPESFARFFPVAEEYEELRTDILPAMLAFQAVKKAMTAKFQLVHRMDQLVYQCGLHRKGLSLQELTPPQEAQLRKMIEKIKADPYLNAKGITVAGGEEQGLSDFVINHLIPLIRPLGARGLEDILPPASDSSHLKQSVKSLFNILMPCKEIETSLRKEKKTQSSGGNKKKQRKEKGKKRPEAAEEEKRLQKYLFKKTSETKREFETRETSIKLLAFLLMRFADSCGVPREHKEKLLEALRS